MSSSPRPTHLRPALSVVLLFAALTVAGCSSGGDDSSSEQAVPVSAAESSGEDVGAALDDETDAAAQAEVPTDGVPFSEVFTRSSEFEDEAELLKALSVIGSDKPGYVSGTTIVAQPSAGEDRQFVCISVDVLDLQTYELIVVDEAGARLDC